jgi:hypothetical protein
VKRILVVDDEENIRELYRDELIEEGYEVELAGDGHDALGKFDTFRPDLVTLDVKMPGLDGLEVRGVQAGFHHLGVGCLHREVPRHEGTQGHRAEAFGGEMTVLSLLYEAVFGKKMPESTREVSLAGALTSGLYEVSQAMSTTTGDMQNSLNLIASAATSILRMERVVILLKARGEEELVVRAMAGIPRGRQFEKYRREIHANVFAQIMAKGEGMIVSEARIGNNRKLLRLMQRLGRRRNSRRSSRSAGR